MDENCDCLLCQKRKLHPELATSVVHDETERPTWPIGDDLPPLSPELQKQVDEAHAWIRGENLPPPLTMASVGGRMEIAEELAKKPPVDRVELMQQIEEFAEFAEFAAERLDAARSELAAKSWECAAIDPKDWKPNTATHPVDCRACGRVLGSPEEFMAHECAAETKDA